MTVGWILLCRARQWVIFVAVFVLLVAVPIAGASTLRLVAPRVSSFASDDARYLAWEVPGRPGVTVLDMRTGNRRTLSAPCPLMEGDPGPEIGGAPAAAGRFLLECGEESRALLDVRTGDTTMLPFLAPHPYVGYGPIWEAVGSRYVIGSAGTSGRCPNRRPHEGCEALYAIVTGKVTDVAQRLVPDPNRAGAPPLCRALRAKAFSFSEHEFQPDVLAATYFGYSDGELVYPEGLLHQDIAEPLEHLHLDRCHGAPRLIATRSVSRADQDGNVLNIVLADGLVTWDTARFSEEYAEDPEQSAEIFGKAAVVAYDLRTRFRRSWSPPVLGLTVTEVGTGRVERETGVFGYSVHTANDVVWVAERSDTRSCGEKLCSSGVKESAIYVAPIK
jgi:hypothetical protein